MHAKTEILNLHPREAESGCMGWGMKTWLFNHSNQVVLMEVSGGHWRNTALGSMSQGEFYQDNDD